MVMRDFKLQYKTEFKRKATQSSGCTEGSESAGHRFERRRGGMFFGKIGVVEAVKVKWESDYEIEALEGAICLFDFAS